MSQNSSLQIAIAVFFIALIGSRYMIMNALKQLSDEDKTRLMSSNMINQSQTRLLIVFTMLGVYYVAINKYPQYAWQLLTGFAVLIILSRIFNFISTKRKLDDLQLPDNYMKAFINSSIVYNIGIIVFFFLLLKDYL